MSKIVRRFTLRKETGSVQTVDMPKRARIFGVFAVEGRVALEAEVYEDEDTKAFDRAHQRHFQLVIVGELIPEGVLVGSCHSVRATPVGRIYHVFEVRGR